METKRKTLENLLILVLLRLPTNRLIWLA